MDQGNPQAGWYDDPEQPGSLRWWDGSAWSDHRQPAPQQPPVPPSPSPTASASVAGPMGSMPAAAPAASIDTWLWQSIVVTVLCCLPLGIVGIVMASQAQTAINQGDLVAAAAKAKQARMYSLIGGGIGLFFVLGFLVLTVASTAMGL